MAKGKRGTKKLKVPREHLAKLRSALIDEYGRDKDVSKDVSAFMTYKRNGLDCTISFSNQLDRETSTWAHSLCKQNMEKIYDDSGYGWCDLDKEDELMDHGGAARFLVVTDNQGLKAGFVHFRFTLQGEAVGVPAGEPALYIMDIQLETSFQRKGLGRHLMRTLEMIARKQEMPHIMMPVVVKNDGAREFVMRGLNGWIVENFSSVSREAAAALADENSFIIVSKSLSSNSSATASSSKTAAESSPFKTIPSEPLGDCDLSAARTPERPPASQEATTAAGDTTVAASEDMKFPSFDPTFGQMNAQAAVTRPAPSAATSALLQEFVSSGVIPSGLGDETEAILEELMRVFEVNNGRPPTAEDIGKWIATIREAVQEAGEDELAPTDEEDGSESDSDEEDEDEDECEEEEEDDDHEPAVIVH